MRIAPLALALVAAALAGTGAGYAQDAMGGFDQPYTNAGNAFGKGAWGDGRGTAIPLPDPGPTYGFYYGQPYSGGTNLFGTGFWTAEYMARTGGVPDGTDGESAMMGDPVYAGGPLGDGVAGGDRYPGKDHEGKGKAGYGHHGKDKGKHGGKDKPHHDKPGHDKPQYKETVRYIPYARTQTVVVSRRSSTVVVMERVEKTELGRLNITVQARSETFTAVCLDGKGNEHEAIAVRPDGGGEAYDGEVFRCAGDQMLRVSYPSDATTIIGAVRTADGTSYKDCDGGDALVRARDGELLCAPKRPMDRATERALALAGGDRQEVAVGPVDYAGEGLDISGLELTGGVGGL